MTNKIRFLINPISGVSGQKRVAETIQRLIDPSIWDFEITYTEYAGHATILAQDAASKGYKAVVAVGGDGTMHETALGLIHSKTALGIIPRGSGNGLARFLKIPMGLDASIEMLNKAQFSPFDTIEYNNGKRAIGLMGLGFDAHVAHKFAVHGKRGLGTYIKIVLKEFQKFKVPTFTIKLDGKVIQQPFFLISIANSNQFGNEVRINPMANGSDGLIEVCMLKSIPLLASIAFGYRLFSGKAYTSKYLDVISCKELEIVNHDNSPLHVDGEPIESNSEFKIKVDPHSLIVITP